VLTAVAGSGFCDSLISPQESPRFAAGTRENPDRSRRMTPVVVAPAGVVRLQVDGQACEATV